jgi:hypothetical protein
MLIERARHEGIRSGSVTLLFRRWRTPQATAGKVYRTALGRVAVTEIDVVLAGDITDRDAVDAGYASARAVVEDLRGNDDQAIYRLRIHFVEEPDPRDDLAASDELSAAALEEIRSRLGRLDAASPTGPWTEETLQMIRQFPAVRAGDLAERLGRDRLKFKLDVRKLKNLGLTISLSVGYELSPRGHSFLRNR